MWNFNNLENYKNALANCNFDFCNEINDIDETVERWTNLIHNLALEHIPHRLATVRPDDQLWYSNNLRKLLRKKKRLHKIAKNNNSEYDWKRFKTIRNKYNNECKNMKLRHENKILNNMVNSSVDNPKKWWSILKKISQTANPLLPLF